MGIEKSSGKVLQYQWKHKQSHLWKYRAKGEYSCMVNLQSKTLCTDASQEL